MRFHRTRLIWVVAAFALAIPCRAFAQKVWSGGASPDQKWSTAGNWVGGVAPVGGDALEFPDSPAHKSATNDFASGFPVASISFSGASGGYTVDGNAVTLFGNVDAQNATSTVNTIGLGIITAGSTFTSAQGGGTLTVSGVISGVGNITVAGAGNVLFSGTNTYTGQTLITGNLQIDNASALGAATGTAGTGTTIVGSISGGVLLVGKSVNVNVGNELLTMNGGILFGGDTNSSWAGAVSRTAGGVMGSNSTGHSFAVNGPISGPGPLLFFPFGTFILGNSANTFTNGVEWGTPGTLQLGAPNAIPIATDLFVQSIGTLDLNGNAQLLHSLEGTGAILLNGGAFLGTEQSSTTEFSGPIVGSGGFFMIGSGKITLSGSNTYLGATTINSGTVIIDGFQQNSKVTINGGVLGGTGTTGSIHLVTGTISPGESPGILNNHISSLPGLELSGGTFVVELNGTTAGSGYDQINTDIAPAFDGATPTLQASLGFAPAPGTQFVIINNSGIGAVTGTFLGLPEGASLSINGQPFTITYHGGTGNDVVLIAGATTGVPAIGPVAGVALALMLMGIAAARLGARGAPTAT